MFLLGSVVNAVAILVGALAGLAIPRMPERAKATVMQGVALAVVLIGLGMALKDDQDILLIIIGLVVGGLIGEWIGIEDKLEGLGRWIEGRTRGGNGKVAEAFVTASLVFCVGAMAIVGAIQSGVANVHKILFAKSLLDMVSSAVFTTTMGFGVALSAVPVLLYQGSIAVLAHFAGAAIQNEAVIACLTATGGLLIVGIGINLLGIRKMHVGNLLPGMFVAPLLKWVWQTASHWVHW